MSVVNSSKLLMLNRKTKTELNASKGADLETINLQLINPLAAVNLKILTQKVFTGNLRKVNKFTLGILQHGLCCNQCRYLPGTRPPCPNQPKRNCQRGPQRRTCSRKAKIIAPLMSKEKRKAPIKRPRSKINGSMQLLNPRRALKSQ